MEPSKILDLPMQENDAEAATIRDYLKALLLGVWEEGEGFSGKRPFGNSGWEYDLYVPLVKAGAVSGKLDDEGFIQNVNKKAGNALIRAAIEALCATPDLPDLG